MKRRVVAIFPELENADLITRIRHKFDPLAELVPPHITLVFPFESESNQSEIRSHIRNAIADMAPFHVRFSGVTGHEGEYLFLNVKEGNDQLIALHDRLYSGLLRSFLSFEHTFVPHMTVGRLLDKSAWDRAVAEVSQLNIREEFEVKEVSVYVIESDGRRWVESRLAVGTEIG